MAKPNNTASNNSAPAAPVAAVAAPASMASKQGTVVQAPPPSPTDVQQDAAAFLDVITSLVDAPAADASADNETTPEAPISRKAKAPAAVESEPEPAIEEADSESDDDEDKPLLEEDDADENSAEDDADADEDEDTEGADKAHKALSKQLFKAREAKRQLKAQLEAAQTRAKELEDQVNKITSAPTAPRFDGFFADVKTLEDFATKESWLEERAAQLEDNDQGFTELDVATNQEVDRDPKWIKQQLRAVRAELKRLPTLRAAMEATLQRSEQSASKAKAVYPFVFDTTSKHHPLVLDLIKEHPELQSSPDRALLLGRLAVAKLVESKQFVLVPKAKKASAPAAAPAQAKPAPVARPAASASTVSPARSAPDSAPPKVLSSRSQQAEDWIRGVVGA